MGEKVVYCVKCGIVLREKDTFCRECGTKQIKREKVPESISYKKKNFKEKTRKPVQFKVLCLLLMILLIISSGVCYIFYIENEELSKKNDELLTRDSDGDGVIDLKDTFPKDKFNTKDTDGDGIGDHFDAFTKDLKEWSDNDKDGYGDNIDAFPLDPSDYKDTDNDGYGDNRDKFPKDNTEWFDTDEDGVGNNGDAFPNDKTETKDTDGDGVGNNRDVFPNDKTETKDTDGDKRGDNCDEFPINPTEWIDSDGDGFGDNSDAFPLDTNEWEDSDEDGIGDNADIYISGNAHLVISITEVEPYYAIIMETRITIYVDTNHNDGDEAPTNKKSTTFAAQWDTSIIKNPLSFRINIEDDLKVFQVWIVVEGYFWDDYEEWTTADYAPDYDLLYYYHVFTKESFELKSKYNYNYNGADDLKETDIIDCKIKYGIEITS